MSIEQGNVEPIRSLFPQISLTVGIGVFIVACGDAASRNNLPISDLLFWVGIGFIFVPTITRLFAVRVPRSERIGLVVFLGIAFYLVKVWQSPTTFALYDELLHVRTINDILQTNHLFQPNPTLPISPYYPGLEIVTDAFISITGLPSYESGIIMLGAARAILMAGLYMIFEQTSGSPRVAGIAAALYTTNSNFLFWGAQFAYQSLALPLSIFILYVLVRRARLRSNDFNNYVSLAMMAIVGMIAVVVTHHITMYLICIFLLLWVINQLSWGKIQTFIETLIKRLERLIPWLKAPIAWLVSDPSQPDTSWHGPPHLFAVGGTLMAILYMFYAANPAIAYLTNPIVTGIGDFIGLITNELKSRTLFADQIGLFPTPAWERYNGLLAIVLVCLVLVLGLLYTWRWLRTTPLAMAFFLVSVFYPASLLLRFSSNSWEISNRLSDFLLIAVSFVLAVGLVSFRASSRPHTYRFVITTILCTIVLGGGIASGTSTWERMPGYYIPSANPRGVEPQGITTAQWALTYLGAGNTMATDRINGVLMGSFGKQNVLVEDTRHERTYFIFFAPQFAPYPLSIVRSGQIRYLMIDKRFITDPSLLNIYYEKSEPHQPGIPTFNPAGYAKFDTVPLLNRIFDGGNLVIYDTRRLLP